MKKQNETIDRLTATRPARAAFLLTLLLLVLQVIPASAQSRSASGDPDTLFNCTWTAAPVVPIPILDSAVSSVGGNLYSFAGVSLGVNIATSYKFDGTTWTPILAYAGGAVEWPAAATDGTDVFIVGGVTAAPVTTFNRYNVATNTYTALAPCPTAAWSHAFVFLNGKFYRIGGFNATPLEIANVDIYDPVLNTWSAGAPLPAPEGFPMVFVLGNFLYACGGTTAAGVESLKTYRYDPVANSWNDAAIADLPATRWGAACATYTDGVVAGGYSGGVIQSTALSWDQPSNTWQPVPNMVGDRARMAGAVLGNSFYVIGGRSTAVGGFTGNNSNQKLLCLNVPTNILSSGGSMIISAGGNGVLDPGETVTVAFGAQNSGGPGVVCTTAALTGTLQASGGVTNPSAPQNYGVVCSPPSPTFRNFTFTVDPLLACGATVTASVQFQDGATNYGTLTYNFVTGTSAVVFSQNFDGVVAPALPAGWTSSATGIGVPWVTSTTNPASAPNDAFAPDPSNLADMFLVTPGFAVPAGGATISFKINYITEPGFDGAVLEFSTDGGATWLDITTGGNAFISGGYSATPISTGFASPIAGRLAWHGTNPGSPAYVTSSINTPAAANGQANVQLRWRMACDNSVAATGVRVDDISIANPLCEAAAPTPSSVVSRKAHGGQGNFDINLPLSGPSGVECRRGQGTGQNDHTIVVTFGSAPSVSGSPQAQVTSGTGTIGSNGVSNGGAVTISGNTVTIPLTNVVNAQVLTVTLNGVMVGAVSGNVVIPMGVLLGDTNDSRSVNAGDALQTRSRSGQITDGTNFRSDVNPDGSIAAGDVIIVRSQAGNSIP